MADLAVHRGRGSLRRRIDRLLVAGLVLELILVVAVTGTALLSAVSGLSAVGDRAVQSAAADVLAGMADQQSGLLAYLDAPSEPASLLLYTDGQQETERALAALRTSSAGTDEAGRAARLEADVRSWQRWAEQIRLGVRESGIPLTDPDPVLEGRRLFSDFRSDQAALANRLQDEAAAGGHTALAAAVAQVAIVVAGSAAVTALLLLTSRRLARRGLDPLGELAGVAGQIAAEAPVSIPHTDSDDEVGELAHALRRWQEASSVRSILAERAPVGICRVGADGRFMMANEALAATLEREPSELLGTTLWETIHPADRRGVRDGHERLMTGTISHLRLESRWLRSDGSAVWCSLAGAPVPAIDGRTASFVGIVEDVTERRLEADRASRIQRRLLPDELPDLPGYRLAATCLPAQDVAGDFYDWTGPRDGLFDLTVADVMGKGLGSALVMATLRTALRATPREMSPGDRVRRLADAMTGALTDEGLFVTMFHARLELASGRLRYVDAGHGYGALRRASGEVARLGPGSLPLGVLSGEEFEEGEVVLHPGDALLVFTDGVVEIGDETLGLGEVERALRSCTDVDDMLSRLVERVRGQQSDDVTVALLQRQPEGR